MNLNWYSFETELRTLAKKINYRPAVIVSIVRGGVVPARLLSSWLQVKEMYCLTIQKYGDERKVATEITDDVSGRDILLVEDMLETGRSMIVAKKYLEKKGGHVKTACLYITSQSEMVPDFYLREVEELVPFPWE